MRRSIGKLLAVTVVLLFACGPVAAPSASGNPSAPAGVVQTGGTLRFGISDDVTLISLVTTKPSQWVYGTMFDQLVSYDPKTYKVRPELAESWTTSADGMEWALALRKDVKWHDGKPFTSADVKFTLDAVMDTKVNAGYHRPNLGSVKSVETDGDYAVRLKMSKPDNELINLLGDFLHMFPAHLLKGVDLNKAADFVARPVGTGAFTFKGHVIGTSYTVAANPTYWKGRPKLDEIVFKVIPDGNTMVSQLKAGELDFTMQLAANQVSALAGDARLRTEWVPTIGYWHLFINNKNPMVADAKTRQALAYGMDRPRMLKEILEGQGSLAAGPVSPLLTAWRNTSLQPYPYDVSKAKALLAEAGWTPGPDGILQKTINGKVTPFKADLIIIPFRAAWADIGLVVQQNWKQLGIDVQLKNQDTNTGFGAVQAGNYVFYIGNRGPIPSPADVRRRFTCDSGGNWDRYCNPQVDKLLAEIQTTPDQAKQKSLYDQVQQLMHEDQGSLFLFYVNEPQVMTKNLGGLTGTDLQTLIPNIVNVGYTR
jgi:peptide/nickel transport system substrate-binding protein